VSAGPVRIPADAGNGLGKLVLAVLEIVRDLLERQALHRVEAGSLSPDEVERLGRALIALEHQLAELRVTFGEHTEPAFPPDRTERTPPP
jgi:hypothetical protein